MAGCFGAEFGGNHDDEGLGAVMKLKVRKSKTVRTRVKKLKKTRQIEKRNARNAGKRV